MIPFKKNHELNEALVLAPVYLCSLTWWEQLLEVVSLTDCMASSSLHPTNSWYLWEYFFSFFPNGNGRCGNKWAGTLMRGPHELIDFTFSVHIYLNTNCHRYSVLPLDSGATNWRSLCEGTDLLPLRYLAHGDVGSACGHEQWPDSDSNVPMSTWMGIGMVVLGTSGRPIAAWFHTCTQNPASINSC